MHAQRFPAVSYYAATANDATRYRALAGDIAADVCVIGGGFSGLSTAIFLADRGAKVVLLEANQVGWGASGRNGGQILGGLPGEERLRVQYGEPGRRLLNDLYYRGHDIIEERIRRFGIACDHKRGTLLAAVKPRHMDDLRTFVDDFARDHPDHQLRLLKRGEVRDALGTDLYCGGMIDGRNAHCHPLNLALGEARGATLLGVAIFEQSPVTGIEHGKRPVVQTATGRVTCDQVVLAGNAYHRLERRRLDGLLFPAGTYVVATEPLDEAVAQRLNRFDLGICDTRMVLDYYRLTADRRLLFGGLCNYSNRAPADIAAALRPRMLDIWPELASTRIEFQWGGEIGIVLTRVPLLGRTAPNVFFLQGYSGHGVNVTHLASEIVADAMAGRSERLEQFERARQFRLPLGQWAGNQLLALGMAYYRVRDCL